MNNVQMGGMNAMGGPVGGGMPMMNNGNGVAHGVRPSTMPGTNDQKAQLNTYIYEYFLKESMYDCAKALLESGQPLNTIKDSPGRRRDENGNNTGNGDDGGEREAKDDFDPKRPADLPDPNLPSECSESCFLFEWWCLFWDMFNAQRGKGEGRNVLQYYNHTQAQSRSKQEQQQMMLRGLIPQNYQQGFAGQQMMNRNQANGMSAQQNDLRQKAIRNTQNATPQQLQIMAQSKQQAMQRDPSGGDNQQHAQSPASAENAPSPSKRPRLDGAGFNPQQHQMPNGRGQGGMPQQVGNSGPSNAIQAAHMQLANGLETNLTAQQFQNMPGNPNNGRPVQSLAGYQQSLGAQQQSQMPNSKPGMPNPGGPQSQGSPMMTQGQQDGAIANYYNPELGGPNGMRTGQGGAPGSGGNHALQDYQMQLMLLEQQNKKRLMMARQEQDNMTLPRNDGGQGIAAVGPNGQPFQGTSPQGARSVNSPNPADQMKRAGHMNPNGMPSPLPEGQSRGSPSGGMGFNIPGGQMDPSMNPQQFMVGGVPNGMRPPSSHPNNAFGQLMTPQQVAMMRQQQQQQQAQGWQGGPNGQMMAQPAVGAGQQIGTPQQRNMPPPSVPAAGAAANVNGRAQPGSPQQNTPAPPTPNQTNKANPKKKAESKESKAKRAAKKGSATNLNAGATPSADTETAGATPTPATPITPQHPKTFGGQNGAVMPIANGQAAVPPNAVIAQPDPLQAGMSFDQSGYNDFQPLDFANPVNGNMDVLQDFDFDSFLHQDGEASNFDFDASAFLNGDTNEIGAE